MTIGQTTTTEIHTDVDAFYDGTLIEPLKTARVYTKYGQKRTVKQNDTVRFNSYPFLSTIAVALVEGVNPSPQKLDKSQITATVSLYGGYVEITEECEVYRIDPVVAIAQERVSWQGVETLDEVTRDVIHGGSNILYANSVAAKTDIVTKIAATDLRKLARAMMKNKVPFFKAKLSASTGVGTQPIQNSWLMTIGAELLYDAENLSGFRNVATYPQGQQEENEVGSCGYFRMIMTTAAPVSLGGGGNVGSTGLAATATKVDVHKCLAFGEDAYGIVDCDGGMKTIRKDKSQVGGALELFSTAGWKARFTAKILDDNRMYRYECGVSA